MTTLALLIAIAAVSAVQSGLSPITGSWTAQFEGRTFLRLDLNTVDGRLTAAMAVGNIELDKEGALRGVRELPREFRPIFDVTRRASTVTFFRKDTADSTPDRFELRLLDTGDAELHVLLSDEDCREFAANGVPPPKPIRLTKR